jgi:hypothetical protein
MSTTIRHLLNEAERKGFIGRTWDKIKNILATGIAAGGLHWGATKLFPKYAAFSRGVSDKFIKGPMTVGAGLLSGDIDPKAQLLHTQLQGLQGQSGPDVDALRKKLTDEIKDLAKEKEKWEGLQQESSQIKRFIKQLGEKNYSVADKYLQRVVETKLKDKIAAQCNKQRLY